MRARRLGSHRDGLGQDVMVALEQAPLSNDFDRCAEEGAELIDEVDLVEERAAGFELDEEIDVAGRRRFTSGDRPEDPDRLRATAPRDLEHLGSPFPQRLECHHESIVAKEGHQSPGMAADMTFAKGESRGESRRVVPKCELVERRKWPLTRAFIVRPQGLEP